MKSSLKIKIRNNEKFQAIFRGQLSGSIFLRGIFRRSILQGAIFWRAYFRGTFFQEQWTWSLFCLTKFLTIPVKTSVSNRSAIGPEKRNAGLDFTSKSGDYHNSWGLNKKEERGKGVQIVKKTLSRFSSKFRKETKLLMPNKYVQMSETHTISLTDTNTNE